MSGSASPDPLVVQTPLSGRRLLADSFLNKGSGFSDAERDAFGLHGLLPIHVSTFEEQLARNYENYRSCASPIEKHVFLAALHDRNETLFYRLVLEHLVEMLPIIYTPTVGEACQRYSHLFRKPRGLYLSYPHRGQVARLLAAHAVEQVDAIVATDGERILGLGDLGVGGMGIPVGKLALYTLCGGVHPQRTLPVFIDVGTDNRDLLSDPLYLGWRHARVRGADYDAFIDEIVAAIKARWPHALLQWEDFAKDNAARLLERHRRSICSFNDDIQGTAAVALAGLYRAVRLAGRTLEQERILIAGAGSAATGIARLVIQALEASGTDARTAQQRVWLIDTQGLVHAGRKDLSEEKASFAQAAEVLRSHGLPLEREIGLHDAAAAFKPTTLIGVTGRPGTFDEPLVRQIAGHVERPIIFPLSNPTAKSEAHPADLLRWTGGRALVATGSPFEPVTLDGKTFPIGQCNNVFIFPGVGMGVALSRAREVPDAVFLVAAQRLSGVEASATGGEPSLFPDLSAIRTVSARIAISVAETVLKMGLGDPSIQPSDLPRRLQAAAWVPEYPRLVPAR